MNTKQLNNILNKIEYECTAEKVLNEIKDMYQEAKMSEDRCSFDITLNFSLANNTVEHFSIVIKFGSVVPLMITISTVEVDINELDNYADPIIKQVMDIIYYNLNIKLKNTSETENSYVGLDICKYRIGGYIE